MLYSAYKNTGLDQILFKHLLHYANQLGGILIGRSRILCTWRFLCVARAKFKGIITIKGVAGFLSQAKRCPCFWSSRKGRIGMSKTFEWEVVFTIIFMQLTTQLINYHVLICIIICYKPEENIIILLSPLTLRIPREGGSSRSTKGFSKITFDWHKL